MSPITHFLSGWAVANSTNLGRRDRALVALAAVLPDLDGAGVIRDLISRSGTYEYYQRYHHVFGHNIFFGLLMALLGLAAGVRRGIVAVLVFVSFNVHILEDIVGSHGLGDDLWAVPYFWPLSDHEYVWSGQWPLNGWQNFAITGVLLGMMFYWAWKRGHSPIELVSQKADAGFVDVIRQRFGKPAAQRDGFIDREEI